MIEKVVESEEYQVVRVIQNRHAGSWIATTIQGNRNSKSWSRYSLTKVSRTKMDPNAPLPGLFLFWNSWERVT